MKTLYLLRHAKAEPGSFTINDEDRPLSERGREACDHIKTYMRKKKYTPDVVLCSTSIRTRETLERIQEGFANPPQVLLQKKLYLATPGEMLSQLQSVDDNMASVLLVGHNPGMHHLAALLSSSEPTPQRTEMEIKYPTGALAVITFKGEIAWSGLRPDSGHLADFITPKHLRAE